MQQRRGHEDAEEIDEHEPPGNTGAGSRLPDADVHVNRIEGEEDHGPDGGEENAAFHEWLLQMRLKGRVLVNTTYSSHCQALTVDRKARGAASPGGRRAQSAARPLHRCVRAFRAVSRG